ncbi:MAG: hypothetical protein LBB18_01960 [Puniceicoccales bacterium]|jgi:hypothetical protein|nr:hypothetical protein [Puniceicoccales bacterium]
MALMQELSEVGKVRCVASELLLLTGFQREGSDDQCEFSEREVCGSSADSMGRGVLPQDEIFCRPLRDRKIVFVPKSGRAVVSRVRVPVAATGVVSGKFFANGPVERQPEGSRTESHSVGIIGRLKRDSRAKVRRDAKRAKGEDSGLAHMDVVGSYAKFGQRIFALRRATCQCMRRNFNFSSGSRERIAGIFRPFFSNTNNKVSRAGGVEGLRRDLKKFIEEVISSEFVDAVFSSWMEMIDTIGPHAFYGVLNDIFATKN